MFKRQTSQGLQGLPRGSTTIRGTNSQLSEDSEGPVNAPSPIKRPKSPPSYKNTSQLKRKAQGSPEMKTKRGKPAGAQNSSSQQTLASFFARKQPQLEDSQVRGESVLSQGEMTNLSSTSHESSSRDQSQLSPHRFLPQRLNTDERSPELRGTEASAHIDDELSPQGKSSSFIDPIESKEGWMKLFTKRPAPLCEDHNEPCISLETKKKGFNCGRSFWICSR